MERHCVSEKLASSVLPVCGSQALNQQCLDTSVTLVLVPQETAGKYFRTCAEATELRIGCTGHTLLEKSRSLEKAGGIGLRSPQETSQGEYTGPEGWGELYTFGKLYSGTFLQS